MLEYIVRPFQAPNAHGTIIIPSTPTPSTETAILTWGGEATLPEVQFIETGFNTRKGREDFDEKNRDAEVVRITGEDPGDGGPTRWAAVTTALNSVLPGFVHPDQAVLGMELLALRTA